MKRTIKVVLSVIALSVIVYILISFRIYYNVLFRTDYSYDISMVPTDINESVVTKIDYKEIYETVRKKYKNNDVVGRLIIDNLNISNYVTKTNDNNYYLNHNIYRNYDSLGNMYVDYRSDVNNSSQINIYGHNSHTINTPFSRLKKYLDKEYYLENRYIYLETDEGIKKYEIFSVYGTTKDKKEHMYMNFDTTEKWSNHFNYFKNVSIYDTGVDINGNDQVLILQTCLYNSNHGKYLVICAKRI